MSNKAQLQENNIDLQQILQSVQDLPTAVPWVGSTIIEPGSEAVTIPAYTDKEITIAAVIPSVNYGTVTLSSQKRRVTIQHGLNAVPKFAVIVPYNVVIDMYDTRYFLGAYNYETASPSLYNSGWESFVSGGTYGVRNSGSGVSSERGSATANESAVEFTTWSSRYGYAAGTYYWFAVK